MTKKTSKNDSFSTVFENFLPSKSLGEDEYGCSNMVQPQPAQPAQPVNPDDSIGLVKLPDEHQQRRVMDGYPEYPEYPIQNPGIGNEWHSCLYHIVIKRYG